MLFGMTKTTTKTLGEYMSEVAKGQRAFVRPGQHAYNVLDIMHPDLAARVNGSSHLDPFYNDDNLPAFFAYVVENWNKI